MKTKQTHSFHRSSGVAAANYVCTDLHPFKKLLSLTRCVLGLLSRDIVSVDFSHMLLVQCLLSEWVIIS